jgi:hypothetical protein
LRSDLRFGVELWWFCLLLVVAVDGLLLEFHCLLSSTWDAHYTSHCCALFLLANADYDATGCRAGENCLFLHDEIAKTIGPSNSPNTKSEDDPAAVAESTSSSAVATTTIEDAISSQAGHAKVQHPNSRRVQRPVPKAQVDDPRTFQLNQLRRRFEAKEREVNGSTVLDLKIAPSDPDFPFDIAALECSLTVPATFPAEKPSLRVTNHEMGRGYQLNVEAGFASIVQSKANGTLLQWLNALDQQLESLLSKEKAETVKIVVNQRKKELAGPAVTSSVSAPGKSVVAPAPVLSPSIPTWSAEQKQNARSKRDLDTRQLEARLGRLPQFFKSSDGLAYTLPVEPRRRSDLPLALQSVKTLRLIVPLLYNLQPCRIELQGVIGPEAEALQKAFVDHCVQNPGLSLIARLNYLSQNMHTMATVTTKAEEVSETPEPETVEPPTPAPGTQLLSEPEAGSSRSHIITIPRPPEWDTRIGGDSSDSEGTSFSDTDDDDAEDHEDLEEEGDGDVPPEVDQQPEMSQAQRGILMSFPNLEMHGIELLEVYSVSIEVKCERCKTQTDIQNVKNNVKVDSAGLRAESCRKCANGISVGTLPEMFASLRIFAYTGNTAKATEWI